MNYKNVAPGEYESIPWVKDKEVIKMSEIFYNVDKIVKRKSVFNFIMSNRGGGKTYGFLKYCIQKFLDTGEMFIYVRRFKSDLKTLSKIFDAVKVEFPNVDFKVQGRDFFINKQLAGCGLALSVQQQFKSTPFPKVSTIIFDEFVMDKGFTRYINDEVESFFELYSTVDRNEDRTTCYFLANAISSVNPYFTYFRIIPTSNKMQYYRNKLITVELFTNQEFIKRAYNTRFGQMIKGTNYAKYSIENEFLRDKNDFINPNFYGNPVKIFKHKNYELLVNYNKKDDYYFITNKIKENTRETTPIIVLNLQELEENTIYRKDETVIFTNFNIYQYFTKNKVFFKNQESKVKFLEIINKI